MARPYHTLNANFRCRLDRASSPPPALKLVAAAVAEAREAFTTLANSTDEAEDSGARATGSVNGSSDSGDASGHRGPEPTKYQFAAIARMLSAIVRNCDFLLKNPRLPVVGLTRLVFKRHLIQVARSLFCQHVKKTCQEMATRTLQHGNVYSARWCYSITIVDTWCVIGVELR